MLTTILIGERFSRPASRSWARMYEDPERYWEIARRLGLHAFTARQRSLITDRLGVTWDMSLNLLGPALQPNYWNQELALRCAEVVIQKVERPVLLVCCGRRVATAFGRALGISAMIHDIEPGDVACVGGGMHLTRVPHPSGRNLQWNNAELIDQIRDRYARCAKRLQELVTS